MAFGDRPKIGTLNAEGKSMRFTGTLPDGPDYPWWHEYLMDEWKRRNHLTEKRTALPGFMQKDRRWEFRVKEMELQDRWHRPIQRSERHALWGEQPAAGAGRADETGEV